jgi:hypothetical protein
MVLQGETVPFGHWRVGRSEGVFNLNGPIVRWNPNARPHGICGEGRRL